MALFYVYLIPLLLFMMSVNEMMRDQEYRLRFDYARCTSHTAYW